MISEEVYASVVNGGNVKQRNPKPNQRFLSKTNVSEEAFV